LIVEVVANALINREKMEKGITLTADEVQEIYKLLDKIVAE
jgi:hypothetical protein